MTTLILDIIGRDRGATKLMKDVGAATDKTNKQMAAFGKIATVAGIAGAAALIKFGKDSVKAYSEAQQSQLKLQDAFARFPKLADTNIAALRGLNTELAKKTRFDDDATASGQAVLAQFKLTGTQITQLTPLLQDYAAKTGRDLPDAAKVLGKAMLGNGRALKDVGIDFKDTGSTAGNFEQIMGGLRTQVGGFAEKEGKTAAGQVEILKNQFGELQEEAGSRLLPVLSKLVGGVTKAVVAFGGLEPGVKGALGGFAVAAPTLLLAAGGIAKIATTAKTAKTALDGMSIAAKKATFAAGGVGIALGVAAIAFGAWAAKNEKAKAAVSDLTDALVASNGAIDENIRKTKAKDLQVDGSAAKVERLGISLDTLTRAHLGEKAAIDEVNRVTGDRIRVLEAMANTVGQRLNPAQAKELNGLRQIQEELAAGNITLEEAQKRAKDLAGASKAAGAGMEDAGKKTKTAGDKIKDANTELKKLTATMWAANTAALALSGAEIATEQAFDDAKAAAKENGKTLDTNTQAGRDNKTSLDNLVGAHESYITKLIENDGSLKDVRTAQKEAKEEFVRAAGPKGMGMTIEAAERLAQKYFGIPKSVTTQIKQRDMAEMQKLADDLKRDYGEVPKSVSTLIKQGKMKEAKQAADDYRSKHLKKIPAKVDTTIGQPGIQKAKVEARQYQKDHIAKIERKVTTPITQPGMPKAKTEASVYQKVGLRGIERRIKTSFSQPGIAPAKTNTLTLGQRLRNLPNVSRFLNFSSNARSLASKLGIKLARGGPIVGPGGGSDDAIPAWLSNGEFVVNARAAAKHRKLLNVINKGQEGLPGGDEGGWANAPRFAGGGMVMKVAPIPSATIGLGSRIGSWWNSLADRVRNSFFGKVVARMKSLVSTLIQKAASLFTPGGTVGNLVGGAGWGPVMAAMRRAGARSFTTYAGHHPSAARARDVTPHSWAIANAARQMSAVWYVIYRMRIASVTRANRAWLPYRPSNFRGDWRHVRHVHVALRDRGGMLEPGGMAVNNSSGLERVLSPRQTRSFDQLVKVISRGGGSAVGNTYIINAPNYVGDKRDLVKALTDLDRQGRLAVVRR